jgi:hypothetical protein
MVVSLNVSFLDIYYFEPKPNLTLKLLFLLSNDLKTVINQPKIENNIKEVRLSTLKKIIELGLGGNLELSIKL